MENLNHTEYSRAMTEETVIALLLYAKNISVDKGAPVRASLCCFLP